MPAGPGARELTALFARIDTAITAPVPGDVKVHNSDRDILNLLSKQAATLHPGIANYCWFTDPSRTLCLQLAGTPVQRLSAGLSRNGMSSPPGTRFHPEPETGTMARSG